MTTQLSLVLATNALPEVLLSQHRELVAFFLKVPLPIEIIWVCSQGRESQVQDLRIVLAEESHPSHLTFRIMHQPGASRGQCLDEGFRKAAGEWILTLPSDFEVPLSEIYTFISQIQPQSGPCIVLGLRGAEKKKWIRKKTGMRKVFEDIEKELTKPLGFQDPTCPALMLNRHAQKALGSVPAAPWFFATPWLHQSRRANILVHQVPINCFESAETSFGLRALVRTIFSRSSSNARGPS